jgi:NTP pyrophosphatase (non-canonical NTP hydrolase)
MVATEAGADSATASAADDLFWLLVDTARTLAARYPEDTGAFVRLAKLTEETGEVAAQINIWAGTGLKRRKHGEFEARDLAAELSDVLRAAVSIAVDFDILDLLITEIRGRHHEILRPGQPAPIRPAARDPASRP